jgi:hypothetical protein
MIHAEVPASAVAAPSRAKRVVVLGMSLATFTPLRVILSLIDIAAGLIVLADMLSARRLPSQTALFLVTTMLTSATGFLFPFKQFGPPPWEAPDRERA